MDVLWVLQLERIQMIFDSIRERLRKFCGIILILVTLWVSVFSEFCKIPYFAYFADWGAAIIQEGRRAVLFVSILIDFWIIVQLPLLVDSFSTANFLYFSLHSSIFVNKILSLITNIILGTGIFLQFVTNAGSFGEV